MPSACKARAASKRLCSGLTVGAASPSAGTPLPLASLSPRRAWTVAVIRPAVALMMSDWKVSASAANDRASSHRPASMYTHPSAPSDPPPALGVPLRGARLAAASVPWPGLPRTSARDRCSRSIASSGSSSSHAAEPARYSRWAAEVSSATVARRRRALGRSWHRPMETSIHRRSASASRCWAGFAGRATCWRRRSFSATTRSASASPD
jgi:hypothetical protein